MEEADRKQLLQSEEMKASLVKRLVIKDKLESSQIKEGSVDTWGGEKLDISVSGKEIHVAYGSNSAKVVTPDMKASNGVIHVVDKVLL